MRRIESQLRRHRMSRYIAIAAALALLVAVVAQAAATRPGSAHVKKDVERHRAMAAAHEAAAKCLESGKDEEQCLRDLQAACKGLAIGKHCGMRHEH